MPGLLTQRILQLLMFFWLLHVNAFATGALTATTDPDYQPESLALSFLQNLDRPIEIVLVYGGWCPDSQREVPRFMRLLELADNPNIKLTDYEVDRAKTDSLGKAEEYGIRYVPTFIVFDGGHELGRVVEKPKSSLESDLVEIINAKE